MTLRIYIERQGDKFTATDLFSVTGTINYKLFENLLSRIKHYVADDNHVLLFSGKGSLLAFKITETPVKYEFELLGNSDDKIPAETVTEVVQKVTGLSMAEMMEHTRKHHIFKPRVVMFCALRYFSHLTVKYIESVTGFDHATVLNSTNKAAASFMLIGDEFVCRSVSKIADELNDARFIDAVKLGKYPVEYSNQYKVK